MNLLRPVLYYCFVQLESKALEYAILFKKSNFKGTAANMGENRATFIRSFVFKNGKNDHFNQI